MVTVSESLSISAFTLKKMRCQEYIWLNTIGKYVYFSQNVFYDVKSQEH